MEPVGAGRAAALPHVVHVIPEAVAMTGVAHAEVVVSCTLIPGSIIRPIAAIHAMPVEITTDSPAESADVSLVA